MLGAWRRWPGIFPQLGFVTAGGVFRQRRNVNAIRSRGIEAQAMLDYDAWGLRLSYAFADAKVRASGPAAELDGRRPAQTPRHQASVTLRHTDAEGLSAALTARYVGAQFENDLGARQLDVAFTVDASAELPLAPGVLLTFAAENLLDAEVEAGVTEAGIIDRGTPRTLWIGLRWAAR